MDWDFFAVGLGSHGLDGFGNTFRIEVTRRNVLICPWLTPQRVGLVNASDMAARC